MRRNLFTHILFSCLFLLLPTMGLAFSIDDALLVASKHFGCKQLVVIDQSDTYAVIEQSTGIGYVIVSISDDASRRILGYSNEGSWNQEKNPPALNHFLKHVKNQFCRNQRQITDNSSMMDRRNVAPLLSCHWHQNSPYNDLAPVIEDGQIKTVAGCVAIAAAQIAYYWRKDNPESTLMDTPTYPYGGAPVTYVIPKGSPNNWELMRDAYTANDSPESRAAAAQLCYVIGTTSYLNYASSTGGNIHTARTAINSQYQLKSSYLSRSKLSQEEWEELLYNEVAKGQPVMCGGGGHAYVIDGYDAELGLFHFNFGWGGAGDGYYLVDDSEDSMGGYNDGVSIVYDIHPASRNIIADIETQNAIIRNGQATVSAYIKNQSTLPIRHIYLFANTDEQIPVDTTLAVWRGDDIDNNGEIQHVFMDFPIIDQSNLFYLTITDENLYVLDRAILTWSSSVEELNMCESSGRLIFDIYGHIINEIKTPGIYIIKSTDGTTSKILIQ